MGYRGHSLLLTVSQWAEIEHQALVFKYLKAGHCFEIASDAATTFNEHMTRHKSTVAQFLSNHYDWFFQEYNSQLLESQNYITKRQAIKLLGNMLLDCSNTAVRFNTCALWIT